MTFLPQWVRRFSRMVPMLLLFAVPVAAQPQGIDKQIEDTQGDVAAYQEELSVLDTVLKGLESGKLIYALTDHGLNLVSRDYYENALGKKVAAGTMTPAEAAARARLAGDLIRMVRKALKDQRTASRLALAAARDRLARLTRGHSRPSPPPPAAANRSGGVIYVTSATYGASCRQPAGNVTKALKTACDGKTVCDYSIDWHVLGDPAFGCRKDFSVQWTCSLGGGGSASAPPEAGYGSKVRLHC